EVGPDRPVGAVAQPDVVLVDALPHVEIPHLTRQDRSRAEKLREHALWPPCGRDPAAVAHKNRLKAVPRRLDGEWDVDGAVYENRLRLRDRGFRRLEAQVPQLELHGSAARRGGGRHGEAER